MTRPITMLSGLQTVELTLTKRGANNRRYAVTKSHGEFTMEPEVLKALMETPAEGEEAFVATLKSQELTDEKIAAAVASFRVQKGMKDLVDPKLMGEVAKAAGAEVAKATDMKEGVDSKKPDATSGKPDPRAKAGVGPVKKSIDLSGLNAETRAQVEAVFKSHAAMAEKASQVDELHAMVKSLRDEAEKKEYVAKAAREFSHLPMQSEELGLMLKSAAGVSEDFAKGFETLLGRMDEVVSKSDAFTTMGAAHTMKSGGAWSKIEQLAEGMVQKSTGDTPLTKAQAIDFVLKSEEGKRLYAEYMGENPQQRAKTFSDLGG